LVCCCLGVQPGRARERAGVDERDVLTEAGDDVCGRRGRGRLLASWNGWVSSWEQEQTGAGSRFLCRRLHFPGHAWNVGAWSAVVLVGGRDACH